MNQRRLLTELRVIHRSAVDECSRKRCICAFAGAGITFDADGRDRRLDNVSVLATAANKALQLDSQPSPDQTLSADGLLVYQHRTASALNVLRRDGL